MLRTFCGCVPPNVMKLGLQVGKPAGLPAKQASCVTTGDVRERDKHPDPGIMPLAPCGSEEMCWCRGMSCWPSPKSSWMAKGERACRAALW